MFQATHSWTYCLLVFAFCSSCVFAQYQALNRKLNFIKDNVDSKIEELTFEVLDLRTEIEAIKFESASFNESSGEKSKGLPRIQGLGPKAAEIQKNIDALSADYLSMKRNHEDLRKEVEEISETFNKSDNEEIELLKEEIKVLTERIDTACEDRDKVFNDKTTAFMSIMTRAFKDFKRYTLTKLGEIATDKKDSSDQKKLDQQYRDITNGLSEKLIALNNSVLGVYQRAARLEEQVSKVENKVDDQLKDCCTGGITGDDYGAGGLLGVTRKPEVKVTGSVSASPGGPLIRPIYGEDLEKYITIGSRVVRGADWSWGNQDGGGPGTVDSWYGGGQYTKQVMVTWDRGTVKRANYRVGAYGKYDLYLLA